MTKPEEKSCEIFKRTGGHYFTEGGSRMCCEDKPMNQKPEKKSWEERTFKFNSSYLPGRLSKQLLEFYKWCREGKSAVLVFPDGKIYSEKAHKNLLKSELQKMIEETKVEEKILKRLKDNFSVPDGQEEHYKCALDEIMWEVDRRQKSYLEGL